MKTVNGCCNLEDIKLHASGGCEAAVTAKVTIDTMKFRKCKELLLRNKLPIKMKGKVNFVAKESKALCLQKT